MRCFASLRIAHDSIPGDLYQVVPLGTIEPDPDMDFRPGFGWTCTSARIVGVAERGVSMSSEKTIRAQAPYLCWDNGTAIYAPMGWALPSRQHLARGLSADDLRTLGQWPGVQAIRACTARHPDAHKR